MGTNYAPLLVNLFRYSYEADFIQQLLKKYENNLVRSFNFHGPLYRRRRDDVMSLFNSKLSDYVDRIYPIELEIKNTTDTVRYVSHLDLHL